jgi:hypothetical protein
MAILNSLDHSSIRNVYIYVGDAVRFDFLPESIARMGLALKAISGGAITPTSFASIISGTDFPIHQIYNFTKKLTNSTPSILRASSHHSAFCNSINHPPFNTNPKTESIIAQTLDTEDSDSDAIERIGQPFVLVERGPGGHAPYGEYAGNASEYFRDRTSASRSTLAKEYASSVNRDAQHFKSQIEKLKKRGLLDETLVIYTSDHGELLGESGFLGHHAPLHRELVEVPCVFIHPDVEGQVIHDSIIRHIDIAPTISRLADIDVENRKKMSGVDLRSTIPKLGRSYYKTVALNRNKFLPTLSLEYSSVWDSRGGYVFAESDAPTRVAAAMRYLTKGPQSGFRRRHPLSIISRSLTNCYTSGAPTFSKADAERCLSRISEGEASVETDEDIEPQVERLRELGYLE